MAKRHDPKKVSKALGLKIRAMRVARGWTLEDTEGHGYAVVVTSLNDGSPAEESNTRDNLSRDT